MLTAPTPRPRPVFVLARDPTVIAAAKDAARRVARPAALLDSAMEALAVLTAPGQVGHQVICDRDAASGTVWQDLVAAAAEQPGLSSLLMVSDHPVGGLPRGMSAVPTDSAALVAALSSSPSAAALSPIDVAALHGSLARGEITVSYQPIIRTADRMPVMVEALARWPSSFPPVTPDIFLPIAARAGLMQELSEAVIRSAAREIGTLRRTVPIDVTVNLPLDLMRKPDLSDWLRRILRAHGLRPANLCIELTENAAIHDRNELAPILRRLRHAGFGVLMDDIRIDDPRQRLFDLDLVGLKLDRSFVLALPRSSRARQILRRMVKAADGRGQVLIAEGVVDVGHLRMLRELGVHRAQGFLISRPLPGSALASWYDRWRGRRPG